MNSKFNTARVWLIYLVPVVFCAGLVLFFNLTSPLKFGPTAILIAFALIYICLSSAVYALFHLVVSILNMIGFSKFTLGKRAYLLISTVTLWPVIILALNTLGGLGVTEVLLVTLLTALAVFYVSRRKTASLA